jgi:hypothetical protein
VCSDSDTQAAAHHVVESSGKFPFEIRCHNPCFCTATDLKSFAGGGAGGVLINWAAAAGEILKVRSLPGGDTRTQRGAGAAPQATPNKNPNQLYKKMARPAAPRFMQGFSPGGAPEQ